MHVSAPIRGCKPLKRFPAYHCEADLPSRGAGADVRVLVGSVYFVPG
jgi:hypothetical protein